MTNPFANTVRFLKAVNLLASPKGTTVKGLMESLGISRRSVFRLLQALDELGFPIADNQPQTKTEKTYRLIDAYVLKLPNIAIPNPCLSAEEIILVLSVMKTCKKFNLVSETPILKSAMEKLAAMMPDVQSYVRSNRSNK